MCAAYLANLFRPDDMQLSRKQGVCLEESRDAQNIFLCF